jgi:hypothetical protein
VSTSSTEWQIITWGSIEYSSTERKIITSWGSIEYFLNGEFSQLRKYSIEPHVIICLEVKEVLNRTLCDNFPQLREKLLHEVLLSTSSTERKIITSWGSIEYFLNWETNYHMRFYWVLPQLRLIITWGSIESWCDNLSLSWGSTQ